MPTISVFYGICIMMYLRDKEHNPPHIHVFYGNESATFYISSAEIWEGHFPKKQTKLVTEFILRYRSELLNMWETGVYIALEGIK